MRYTALSLIEPWLQLILSGKKKVEFRTWQRPFRGDLLLCASKKWEQENADGAVQQKLLTFEEILDAKTYRGYARALVHVDRIVPATEAVHGEELGFFYHDLDRVVWAWELSNVRKIRPFQVKGERGLFSVEHDVEKE